MSPLFETIKVKDGQFFNLDFHNARLNEARKANYNCSDEIDLENVLYIPKSVNSSTHKCKVIYDKEVISIHFQPYHLRPINVLKIVHDNSIDYSSKWLNRNQLNKLFSKRENCDDVLIIKDGLITDTSYANIIFFDGKKWFTPKNPLLKGTKRAKLLKENKVFGQNITIDMLSNFQEAKIINAMIDMEDTSSILIKNIF